MELAPHAVQGGILGLLCCYNVREQTIDFQLAGSADGRLWSRPSRQPALPVSPLGDYGGGMLWPARELIEHEGRIHMYFAGTEGLHGDTSFGCGPNLKNFYGAICRASWEVDRYWAVVSGAGGMYESSFRTHAVSAKGKTLILNAATSTVAEGELTAELTDEEGKPIPGFTRSDYQPWQGDSKAQPARWRGGNACPRDRAAARFFLRRSRLYGYAWQ